MTARQRLIRRIERARKTRVILLVHRQETMQILGIPLLRYIDVEDSEAIINADQLHRSRDADRSRAAHAGGLVLASYQIARALNRRTRQGHRLRSVLCDVGRNAHRACGGRDRDE
jgi:ClpP class serine protease